MEVNVRDTGDLSHLLPELLCNSEVAGTVDADHLDINRRGQAEVEDLAGDVRRLEIERAFGEAAGELAPQLGDIIRRRAMH